MTARSGILCGGCILVDVNKTVSRWPPEEQVAFILSANPQCGGPGFNMAVDLARLGAPFPIAVVGAIGADGNGALVERTCDAHGIDRSALRRFADIETSYTDVMIVKETGRRTFFHAQAANGRLAVEHFPIESSSARIFHLGSPGLHETLDQLGADGESGFATLFKRARAAGMWTNLELVPLRKELVRAGGGPLLPHLSSIIINDHEAEALTGLELINDGVTDQAVAAKAAEALLALGVSEIAIIHFPMGAVAAMRGSAPVFQPSVAVPPDAVVSANGAGDAFASGVVFGLHEGWPVTDCLKLGHAAAAASLRATSTFEGVISAQECLALAARWGWRGS